MDKRVNQKLLDRLMDLQDTCLGYRDDRDEPKEYANYKTNEDLLHEAEYILGTYYEGGHMNEELKYECPKAWYSDTSRLKRLINTLKKEIAKETQ